MITSQSPFYLAQCLNSVLNVKALVDTFNQQGLLHDCTTSLINHLQLYLSPLYLMSSSPRLWTAQLTSQYLRDASSTWSMKKVRSSAL